MGSPCYAANSQLYYCSPSSPSMAGAPSETTIYVLYILTLLTLFALAFSLSRRLVPFLIENKNFQSAVMLMLFEEARPAREESPARLKENLLLELLPSNSPNWGALFSPVSGGEGEEGGKRKRKREKKNKNKSKKSRDLKSERGELKLGGEKVGKEGLGFGKMSKDGLLCLYPVTSSSSATQRRIKQQFDQLVKAHDSKKLTLAEVGNFDNSLVDAQTELQQKSEAINRKLSITRSLLLRADKSSFGRIQKQLEKLELEQKRLEEDAFVYIWLQKQLKLSPVYQKMLENGASMEAKAKSDELAEDSDSGFADISFEELLAQEKKDSFWQKHSKIRSSPA